jgi:DNA-binding NtrC family response regulator
MRRRIKVLIVEDDQPMARMCAKLIQRRGHSALVAGSSLDALSIMRSVHDVDVVVSDVQMPEITGIQLLSRLRAIDGTLPIILMTGYGNTLTPNQVAALGATDYITKPFDSETLLDSVERAFRMRN